MTRGDHNMEKLYMKKISYDGYYVGTGVQYPGIIVWGKNNAELIERFKAAIPTYKKGLEKYGIEEPMEIIELDRKDIVN